MLATGPRRFRSLAIGLVIAAALAAFLFLGLGTSGPGNNSSQVVGVGSVAPNFTLPRLGGGQPVRLDAVGVNRHRPVVLNFFASWCIPCRAETPLLARTANAAETSGSPVQFVGVDVNDPNGLSFVRHAGITYPVGSDNTLHVTAVLYGLNGQPNTFFIDATGHIVGHVVGALTPTELNRWIGRLTTSAG